MTLDDMGHEFALGQRFVSADAYDHHGNSPPLTRNSDQRLSAGQVGKDPEPARFVADFPLLELQGGISPATPQPTRNAS